VFAAGATIDADDCLIADCQNSCLFMWIGGSYQFDQCTFANYWGIYNGYPNRSISLLYLNDYYETIVGDTIIRPIKKASFGNCIIYGNLNEEITFDTITKSGANCNYFFQNCVVKTKHNTLDAQHYSDTTITTDPGFNNIPSDEYLVADPGSATNKANPTIARKYPLSLDNEVRIPKNATIGAYQQ
jgi:hypothetical protein